ncbi:DUF397 domain-containing protein [Actinomadura hibisca]|uniref:DUF397 domain-containing protein n=1 Tax=Actinomadura hibisca TaxID=68565 RepID=UPI00082A639C|nr:DUF397 domain-containing protein [Actinomadura hibisca]
MDENVTWRKARRSNDQGGDCVELGDLGTAIGVRDSKNPDGGHLVVERTVLKALMGRIKYS